MKIPITCYDEIKNIVINLENSGYAMTSPDARKHGYATIHPDLNIEWIDVNGINTPYIVTVVNKEDK